MFEKKYVSRRRDSIVVASKYYMALTLTNDVKLVQVFPSLTRFFISHEFHMTPSYFRTAFWGKSIKTIGSVYWFFLPKKRSRNEEE